MADDRYGYALEKLLDATLALVAGVGPVRERLLEARTHLGRIRAATRFPTRIYAACSSK